MRKDHPHACGDKLMALATFSTRVGSSPRVWGQAGKTTDFAKFLRIIPTRVGTSVNLFFNSALARDHPHACGDKIFRQSLSVRHERIIPTRVGTSSKRLCGIALYEDHPHACGDKHKGVF